MNFTTGIHIEKEKIKAATNKRSSCQSSCIVCNKERFLSIKVLVIFAPLTLAVIAMFSENIGNNTPGIKSEIAIRLNKKPRCFLIIMFARIPNLLL